LLDHLKLILLDGLELWILHLVRMTLEDELSVSATDGREVGIFGHTESLIGIWW
jgi:hypothetical protein